MAQPLRLEFEEAIYHITARGNRRERIFGSDQDRARTNAGGVTYVPNNLNQYTSVGGVTVSNGNNGNLSGYNGWSYSYDSMNRLTGVTGPNGEYANFYYDGLGRQVARGVSWTNIRYIGLWDGWNLAAEYGAGGTTPLNRWIYAGNDLIRSPLPQQIYYYPDGLGSTTHLADASGNLIEKYTYDAYGTPTFYDGSGTVLPSGSAYGVDQLFTGQKWYSQLGLYDLRNRAYLPSFGRFLQPDPIGFAGDPANLYRYCGNNPVNLSDPSGLDVRVVEYPASIWGVDYNHVGVHVTGMPATQAWTVGYYPNAEHSPDAPGVVKPDLETPIPGRSVDIPTTIDQDEAANAYIDQVTDNSGDEYTFWDQNCARFVEGVLKAAGLPNVPTSVVPGTLINKLKKQYDKGPFADVHVTLRNGGGGGGGFGLGGGGGLLGVGTVMWGGEPWGAGVPNGNVIIDWKNVKAYKKG